MCYLQVPDKNVFLKISSETISIANKRDVENDAYFEGFHGSEDSCRKSSGFSISFQNAKSERLRMCAGATKKRMEVMAFSCEVKRENVRLTSQTQMDFINH